MQREALDILHFLRMKAAHAGHVCSADPGMLRFFGTRPDFSDCAPDQHEQEPARRYFAVLLLLDAIACVEILCGRNAALLPRHAGRPCADIARSAIDVPDAAKPENVSALFQSARTYAP